MARKPKKEAAPAYQWYPKDHLSDTQMTLAPLDAEGLYRRLYDIAWLENGLPGDLSLIFGLSKCKERQSFDALWVYIGDRFPIAKDGKRRSHDQEAQRRKQRAFRKSRKAAAHKRWKDKELAPHAVDARASQTDARAVHVESFALASAFASSKEVQVDQIHRRAARAGLSAEEREIRKLIALCQAQFLQPRVAEGRPLPHLDVLAVALRQEAAARAIAVSDATAKAAAERSLRHWEKTA